MLEEEEFSFSESESELGGGEGVGEVRGLGLLEEAKSELELLSQKLRPKVRPAVRRRRRRTKREDLSQKGRRGREFFSREDEGEFLVKSN